MPVYFFAKKRLWPALAGLLFCLFLASPAWAIDYTWVGPVMGSAGDWANPPNPPNPINWSPAPTDLNAGPVPGDTITFDTNVNLRLGADRVVNSITINSDSMSFINFAIETTNMTVGDASISAINGMTVNNGTLNIDTRYEIISGDLIINGSNNITGAGVFFIDAGSSILLNGNQNIRLSNTQVDPDAEIQLSNGALLTILEGAVPCPTTGDGSLNINSPGRTVSIEDRGQTYSGFTRVSAGALRARWGDLPNNTDLTILAGAMAQLGGQTLNTISGSGNISIYSGTVQVAGTSTFSGNISEDGDRSLIKDGPGTLTLTGNVDTDIVLDSGGLVFNGTAQQTITQNGGTLKGTGTCNDLLTISGGVFEPGRSIGTFSTAADFVMQAASDLDIEVSGYSTDQVSVGGDVTLNNPILSVSGTPYRNHAYTIIKNNGPNPVIGTFNMQPEGSDFEGVGGYFYRITYQGGDGNDVVLTSLNGINPPSPAPEPSPEGPPAPSIPQGSGPSPAGSLDGSQLSWPGVKGASHYRIYRADCPKCKRKEIGRVKGTSFIDNTAEPGRPYYYWVRAENGEAIGYYSSWMAAWRYEQNPGRAGDFNGDGVMDLLWWNPDDNHLYIWFMMGGQVTNVSAPIDSLDISQWLLIGTGDFNGDGLCDLLWWKPETGEILFWYMQPSLATASSAFQAMSDPISPTMPSHAALSYTGDLNGDGFLDILWRDYASGDVAVWLMGEDGKPLLTGPPIPADDDIIKGERPGLSGRLEWQVAGLRDANGDGKADVIWQDERNNRLVTWFMDGSTISGVIQENKGLDTVWRLVGVGDLNADSQADIVWRNEASGEVKAWLMQAGKFQEERVIIEGPDEATQWQVKAVGDFCSPGCDDVYCKHSESGAAKIVTLGGEEFTPVVE
jgi:hypothetical protein